MNIEELKNIISTNPVLNVLFFTLIGLIILIIAGYQIKRSHFLLTFLVIGLITYFSDFAKLNINIGIPIFMTEGIMLLLVATIVFKSLAKHETIYSGYPLKGLFFVFYTIVVISFVRGMIAYGDKVYVLRQSAMFYYSIFMFLIPLLYNSLEKIENAFKLMFAVYLVFPLIYYDTYCYFYCPIFIIFEVFYLKYITTKRYRYLLILAILLQSAIVVYAQVRASWIGFMMAGAFLFCLGVYNNKMAVSIVKKLLRFALYGLIAGIICVPFMKEVYLERLVNEIGSVVQIQVIKNSTEVEGSIRNNKWRIYVWKDIINESMKKPMLGWGFGNKFVPETIKKLGWGGSWRDSEKGFQDPHNSMLSILYRTGIIGIFVFLLIIYSVIRRTLKLIRIIDEVKVKAIMLASLTSIIYILTTSLFMVVLEGPHLGISLWYLIGIIISLEMIDKRRNMVNYEHA